LGGAAVCPALVFPAVFVPGVVPLL